MKRLIWLLSLCPVFLSGCFIPLAYPTWSQTPLVPLDAPNEEVHAFRVHVKEDWSGPEFWKEYEYTLAPVPTLAGHSIPQTTVSADYGCLWLCVALNFVVHTHHTLELRLYRPGYETVEIKSWDLTKEIAWKKADDLAEHEKAIDDLLSGPRRDWGSFPHLMRAKLEAPGTSSKSNKAVEFNLQPGSESRAHKKALLFGAEEYERLAASFAATNDELRDTQARLLAKAAWLRKRAAE
ncbi:MAG: hypothetical protein HY040_28750 [Planctomycetes bacterium]|nr:hypothetical protein [Planctomycetota bacterium]